MTTTNVQRRQPRPADTSDAARHLRGIDPLLLTIPDAAQVLAVGRTTMYELIGSGEISLVRIGRSVRISVAALEDFVARHDEEARATVRNPSTAMPRRR